VRELKNLVERAVYRSDSSLVTEIVFDPFCSPFGEHTLPQKERPIADTHKPPVGDLMDKPFNEAVRELKIRLLKKALNQAKHNQKKAAKILGLSYHQFRGLYRKYSGEVE